jgi:hypothetical protein
MSERKSAKTNRWSCEITERYDPDPSRFLNPQPETRAERAFHLGGAGAPAHASCRKEPRSTFARSCRIRGARSNGMPGQPLVLVEVDAFQFENQERDCWNES